MDWQQLMINGSVKLYWQKAIFLKDLEKMEKACFDVYRMDCINWDERSFHKEIAATLKFPDYYGENLNAFNDCLSDIWTQNKGIVLSFENFDVFAAHHSTNAILLLDIIQLNAWRFLFEQIPLLCFVQSNNPTFSAPPLGGMAPEWNNQEWFNKDRGL